MREQGWRCGERLPIRGEGASPAGIKGYLLGVPPLLHVGEGRSSKSLLGFFRMFGRERTTSIRCVCSDMWRAYLKVQGFQLLWTYTSPVWAGKFLDVWCRDVMRSRLDPLKQFAASLRAHRPLILNWFAARKQYNSGIVEGPSANVKLRFRKAYGIRTFKAAEIAL